MLINTLGLLQVEGFSITAHCGRCQHSAALNLDSLVQQLGAGFVAVGDPNPLAGRLRCAKCRDKTVGLILSPSMVPTPGLGLYGKAAGC